MNLGKRLIWGTEQQRVLAIKTGKKGWKFTGMGQFSMTGKGRISFGSKPTMIIR